MCSFLIYSAALKYRAAENCTNRDHNTIMDLTEINVKSG